MRRSEGLCLSTSCTSPCPMKAKRSPSSFQLRFTSSSSVRVLRSLSTKRLVVPSGAVTRRLIVQILSPSRSRRETSASFAASRLCEPRKSSPLCRFTRSRDAVLSPSDQRSASSRLLLPLPFGPTIAVKPGESISSCVPPKLLKPLS